MGPAIGIGDLRAEKARRQHHLPAQRQAVERQMMAEQLPAPGPGGRGLAEQAEGVAPFVQHARRPQHLAEEGVEAHDAHTGRIAGVAQAGAHDRHGEFAHRGGGLLQPQPVRLGDHLGVLPLAPQGRADRMQCPRPFRRRQGIEQPPRRRGHRLDRRALRLQGEQAVPLRAVGREADEGPVRQRRPFLEQLARPGRFQARGRMRLGGHAGNARLIGTGDIRTVVQTRHAAFLQRGPGLARRHQRADSAPEQISRYLSDRSRMACPSLKLVYGYTHSHRESIYVRVRLLPPRIRFAANMLIETPCDRVTLTGIKNFDLVCIRHVSDKVGLQPLNFFELSISRYTKVLYLSCV